jgi:tripartite-type tricarboxylate transporter receptor subunit TctC
MRDALVTVLNTPSVKAQIAALGAVATSTTPDDYRKLMQQESIKWAAVIKKGHITLE